MHELPRVRELEERFPDLLTVIGVHAGKFITERITERIAEACDRLDVVHAVVNDRQFRVWRDFGAQAWPTIGIVDPDGYLVFMESGELTAEEMGAEIERIAVDAESRGTLVRGPDPLKVSLPRHQGTLRFPTRAVLDAGRLWVSDTGHGRVLECSWDAGTATASIVAEHAGFVEPRGLASLGGHMHVADRRGQAVWRLDGTERARVAGTGRLGGGLVVAGQADRADLRSPWGLASVGGRLAISMAGTHQLWMLDPGRGDIALLAGNGGEDVRDGTLTGASLAQPTGLAPMPVGALAFADCESSAVRVLSSGSVVTLVGTGLFEFGDRDGTGDEVLLQHCEDVAFHEGYLSVADTYNDRMKQVDPATRECAPWPGAAGEKGELREPAGVWSDGSTLLVADTGHHRVVSIGPDGSVTEIRFD
jgi:hypothetical protein